MPASGLKFPDEKGYWPGAKSYEICKTPTACRHCLLYRHLKKECNRLVNLRLNPPGQKSQLDLFGGEL